MLPPLPCVYPCTPNFHTARRACRGHHGRAPPLAHTSPLGDPAAHLLCGGSKQQRRRHSSAMNTSHTPLVSACCGEQQQGARQTGGCTAVCIMAQSLRLVCSSSSRHSEAHTATSSGSSRHWTAMHDKGSSSRRTAKKGLGHLQVTVLCHNRAPAQICVHCYLCVVCLERNAQSTHD